MIKGITKKWLIYSLGITLVVLISVIVFFSFTIQSFFYNGIRQTLLGRSNELAITFNNYTDLTSTQFNKTARTYVENFPDKELMELMIINSYGNVVITSTGFEPGEEYMPDYIEAIENNKEVSVWTEKMSSGEDVMAITRVVKDSSGNVVGSFRYVVSLEAANREIFLYIITAILSGLVVTFLLILSGAYFTRSIVLPISEINDRAKEYSRGNFNSKIENISDDEIGELSLSINNMAQELANTDQMKNDFISSVSHEIRTPLTAIKGWAETMSYVSNGDPTMEKGLSIIVSESERLTTMVEELLDFSRIQNGKMVLVMEQTDIIAELSDAIYMLRDKAMSENKHLLYEEPISVILILADKNRIRQVFLNIIENAIKYTNASGVIGVQITKEEQTVKIVVSDNGCGIPAIHLPKIKEKFYKANQTVRGSGIGLAVADEIVSLHNGTLDIESTEDIGTTVTITFPLIVEDEI